MTKQSSMIKAILSLIFLVILMPLAMDIYVPAIPELIVKMHSTPAKVQITLSIFLVVYALSQLIIGPLSDQIGRIKTALMGAVIFVVACGLASLSDHVFSLIICRVFQALGAAMTFVAAFAMVRDLFDGDQNAKIYSYLNGAIAFSPIFGPAIGSWFDLKFGWPSVFIVLMCIGVACAVVIATCIRETLPPSQRMLMSSKILSNYLTALKNTNFIWCSISMGVGIAYLFTFFSLSPYIILTMLHLGKKMFGLYFAFMGVAFMVGSFLGARTVGWIGRHNNILLGHFIAFIGGAWLVIWYLSSGLHLYGFLLPMLPIGIGGTLSLGSATSSALEPFSEIAGLATALLGFIQATVAAITGTIAVGHGVHSPLPLGIVALILSGAMILVFLVLKARRKPN